MYGCASTELESVRLSASTDAGLPVCLAYTEAESVRLSGTYGSQICPA